MGNKKEIKNLAGKTHHEGQKVMYVIYFTNYGLLFKMPYQKLNM